MKAELLCRIKNEAWMMNVLKIVQELNLPDCWIGAGFVRNKAWNILHDYSEIISVNDIDIVFFDNKNTTQEYEEFMTNELHKKYPTLNWEVINQARTHLWHNRLPYKSTEEAISEWVETATSLGIRLNKSNQLELIAPHGLFDLENLILRPVPSIKDLNIFYNRIEKKKWLEKWPKLKIQI